MARDKTPGHPSSLCPSHCAATHNTWPLKATLCHETIGQTQILCFPLLNQNHPAASFSFFLTPPLLKARSIFPIHVSPAPQHQWTHSSVDKWMNE